MSQSRVTKPLPIYMFGWLAWGRDEEDASSHQDVASDQPKSSSLAPFDSAGYSFSALQQGPSDGFAGFVVRET